MNLISFQDVHSDIHYTQQYLQENSAAIPTHLVSTLLNSLKILEQELHTTQEFLSSLSDTPVSFA